MLNKTRVLVLYWTKDVYWFYIEQTHVLVLCWTKDVYWFYIQQKTCIGFIYNFCLKHFSFYEEFSDVLS